MNREAITIFSRKFTALSSFSVDIMIVGLGNPGAKYDLTRHNAGFMAIDLLAKKLNVSPPRDAGCKALISAVSWEGKGVLLVKPQTFMNLSGESVRELALAYHLGPEKILVLFDDVHISSGMIRVRRSGSDGGHNGIKNIIYHLQSDAFPRIKIGVGSPCGEDMKDYVLDVIDSDAYEGVKAAAEAATVLLRSGVDAAMQEFNGKDFSISRDL